MIPRWWKEGQSATGGQTHGAVQGMASRAGEGQGAGQGSAREQRRGGQGTGHGSTAYPPSKPIMPPKSVPTFRGAGFTPPLPPPAMMGSSTTAPASAPVGEIERREALKAAFLKRVGQSSAASSSTAAEEGPIDIADMDDKDDVDTMASSKRSSTRSNRGKGAGKLKKLRLKAAAHRAKQGLTTWKPEEMEARNNEAARKALFFVAAPPPLADQYASQLWSATKAEADKRALAKPELLASYMEKFVAQAYLNGLGPAFETELMYKGFYEKAGPLMLDNDMCRCCNKQANEWHMQSNRHQFLQLLYAGMNYMLGESSKRHYNKGLVLPRGVVLTKQLCWDYWGPSIEDFPRKMMQKALDSGTVKFSTKTQSYDIEARKLKVGTLCMVPYTSGLGRYLNNAKAIKPVAFACVPDGTRVEDNDDLMRINELDEDSHLQDNEQNLSWWPVAAWMPAEGYEAELAWLFTQDGVAWVSCLLQALEHIIVAWQLYEAMWAEQA